MTAATVAWVGTWTSAKPWTTSSWVHYRPVKSVTGGTKGAHVHWVPQRVPGLGVAVLRADTTSSRENITVMEMVMAIGDGNGAQTYPDDGQQHCPMGHTMFPF